MTVRPMPGVAARNLALRDRAYEGLARSPRLRMASAPPSGSMATALVAAYLPDEVDSSAFRAAMRDEHAVIVKMAEKRWFNGSRLSPHRFNDEADIDRALRAIRAVLG